jgi:hypothetical protein
MLARQHILETQGRLWRRKLAAMRQDPRLQFGADDLRQVQAGLQREAQGCNSACSACQLARPCCSRA